MALNKVSSGVAGFLEFHPLDSASPDGPSKPMAGVLAWRKMRDMDGELEWRACFEYEDSVLVLPSHRALISNLERVAEPVDNRPTGKVVKIQRTGMQEPKARAGGVKKKQKGAPKAYFLYDVWEATGTDAETLLADEEMHPANYIQPQKDK